MSPASKQEFGTLVVCQTKIKHLEEQIKDLKEEFASFKNEQKASKERISDRRLSAYPVIASIVGGLVVGIILRAL